MSGYGSGEIVAKTALNVVPETLFVQSSIFTELLQNRRNSLEQSNTERPAKCVVTQAMSEGRESGN